MTPRLPQPGIKPMLKNNILVHEKKAKLGESEMKENRISDLPNCLILCILSLLTYKDAVRTCILSRRWEHLWKFLPTLVLHESDFRTKKIFNKVLPKLLSFRDPSFALQTLDFKGFGIVEPHILKRVISYAISHEVQQLAIEANVNFNRLPPIIFSSIFFCETLTYLKLSVVNKDEKMVFPKSLNLPALTSLNLWNIHFIASENGHADPFKTLKKLNNLVLYDCTATGLRFYISSTTLLSLAICQKSYGICEFWLSTPNLCSFALEGGFYPRIYGTILSSVNRVNVADILHSCSKPPLLC
ncbi:hypothetical protein Lal_00041863 [Lupinus albus]|nr:hypothetical protein Lal_00041863 [Lupinus albus]